MSIHWYLLDGTGIGNLLIADGTNTIGRSTPYSAEQYHNQVANLQNANRSLKVRKRGAAGWSH